MGAITGEQSAVGRAFDKACQAVKDEGKRIGDSTVKATSVVGLLAIGGIGTACALALFTPFAWPLVVVISIVLLVGVASGAITLPTLLAAGVFAKTFVKELVDPSVVGNDQKIASVKAAVAELSRKMEQNKQFFPNFRIAADNQALVNSWMLQPPVDFSKETDANLINYIKKMNAELGLFTAEMTPKEYKNLDARTETCRDRDDATEKTTLVTSIKNFLKKDENGNVAGEVRQFIELLGKIYERTDKNANSDRNFLSFAIACVRPFCNKIDDGTLSTYNNIVIFVIENHKEIIV